MATGAGKSMLFMLPAAIVGSGVTVVIAPLNALLDDQLDRCEAMGIRAARWDGKRPPYWASIVLVTPEGAVSAPFGRFLDEKRNRLISVGLINLSRLSGNKAKIVSSFFERIRHASSWI